MAFHLFCPILLAKQVTGSCEYRVANRTPPLQEEELQRQMVTSVKLGRQSPYSRPWTAEPTMAGEETMVITACLVLSTDRHQTKRSVNTILFVPYSNPI